MAKHVKILSAFICVSFIHIIRLLVVVNQIDVGSEKDFESLAAPRIVVDAKRITPSTAEITTKGIPSNSKATQITESTASILEELPAALQLDPPLFTTVDKRPPDICCRHWNEKRKRKNGPFLGCRGICFTPQACSGGNEIYPFRDEEEKEFFGGLKNRSDNTSEERKNEIRSKCIKLEPSHQQPPNRWNTTLPFPFADDLPPPGCSLISPVAGGSFQSLYVIPGAKLAFCGIPKVGITNWLQFIRFVMGAHDYVSFPHGKPDLRMWSFDLLEPKRQEQIWNDPEWTFAAFLRNPAERLLSAYLDKVTEGRYGSLTFDDFLEGLERELPEDLDCKNNKNFVSSLTGMSWCTDPHWRPQTWSCGMSEKIDRFDFIGSLDYTEQHSRALLERVGLWESYGKSYRNGNSNRTAKWDKCVNLFPLQDEFESIPVSLRHVGFQQRKPILDHNDSSGERNKRKLKKGANETQPYWDSIGHARGASTKMKEYYTPELHRKVEDKLFKAEYQVWKFLDNENGDWVSGKDILPHLLLNAQQEKNP
jgi:hypothetical protein